MRGLMVRLWEDEQKWVAYHCLGIDPNGQKFAENKQEVLRRWSMKVCKIPHRLSRRVPVYSEMYMSRRCGNKWKIAPRDEWRPIGRAALKHIIFALVIGLCCSIQDVHKCIFISCLDSLVDACSNEWLLLVHTVTGETLVSMPLEVFSATFPLHFQNYSHNHFQSGCGNIFDFFFVASCYKKNCCGQISRY